VAKKPGTPKTATRAWQEEEEVVVVVVAAVAEEAEEAEEAETEEQEAETSRGPCSPCAPCCARTQLAISMSATRRRGQGWTRGWRQRVGKLSSIIKCFASEACGRVRSDAKEDRSDWYNQIEVEKIGVTRRGLHGGTT
jgi:hypothetical protein